MFRIGEFSKIAQVSGRLLRYYNEIGLLQPAHTDAESGYRYYTADQLPRLNRILALKELGLSLDQIRRMMDEDISTDEMRGMLMMKKAQVEQHLIEELRRMKGIESRIAQIDDPEGMNYDVVVKPIEAQKFFSVREICASPQEALAVLAEMRRALPAHVGASNLGQFAVMIHSPIFEWTDIDLELGYFLNVDNTTPYRLSDGRDMLLREVPAIPEAASVVRLGGIETAHTAYQALGRWIATNGYDIAGSGREVFIHLPPFDQPDDTVIEIQFPVVKVQHDNVLSLS